MEYKKPAYKAVSDATVAAWISDLESGVSDETKSDLVGYIFPEATIRRKM